MIPKDPHSKNTMVLKLAYQLPTMQIEVHTDVFATYKLDHFPNRSYQLVFVWPLLLDEVLRIAMQHVQRRNHVVHRVDQHPFPNIYGERDDHGPMYRHHAVITKKSKTIKLL